MRGLKSVLRGGLLSLAALAFTANAQAAPDRYHERDHDHHGPEIHRPGQVFHELPAGARMMELHGVRYYERGGVYFRPAAEGYIVVDAPPGVAVVATPGIGSITATLPLGAVTVTVGGNVFYRHGNVFYRHEPRGYVVVAQPPSVMVVQSQPAPPQVISAGPAPATQPDYVSVWVGDQEYFTRDGIFYRKVPEGFRQIEAPVGVLVSNPPAGSLDMWIGDQEYFYFNSIFYQKRPNGFQIVAPPPNAYIKAMPKSARPVFTAGSQFFYLGGNFYQQRDQGFLITAPPLVLTPSSLPTGSTVPAPPDGAIDLWVAENEYLYFAGNFYRKLPTGYVVVSNPLT